MDDYLQMKIIPDYDSARKLLGFNEYDDPKDDDILYIQSYYMEVVDIEDNDIFGVESNIQN